MKFYMFFCIICFVCEAQVGIGTTAVDKSILLQLESTTKAFVPPRMSQLQMSSIAGPVNGDFIFNNTEDIPYLRNNAGWSSFEFGSCPSIQLYYANGTFPVSPTSDYFMALDNSRIISNSNSYFQVVSNGVIKILKDGTYLITAALSTKDLPPGNRKINFYLNQNSILKATFSKTNFNFPSLDYWGVSGSTMQVAQKNDVFEFKYFINIPTTGTLSNAFQTLSIIKIN